MKCYLCDSKLIWGGDNKDDEKLISNFSCPDCEAFVLFYHPGE